MRQDPSDARRVRQLGADGILGLSGAPSARSHEILEGETSLAAIPANATAKVLHLYGGRDLVTRLAALGLTPGVEVRMIQNFGHGPLIVLVRGTRLALGRREAGRVHVQLAG